MNERAEAARIVLFYDGTCGLCARSVAWCLEHDRAGALRYAPLQGTTYEALPHADKPRELDTVVLLDRGALLVRSDAVLRAMQLCGGPWGALAAIGRAVPRPLREAAYRYVAVRRLGWFGHADACALATKEQRERFLP